MMKRRSALLGSALCFILSATGWSEEPTGKEAPHKGVRYLGNHRMPSDTQRKVTHITGAHFVSTRNDSAGRLFLLSGDAGAGFTGTNGWSVFSKPHYYEVNLSRLKPDRQNPRDSIFSPNDVTEYQITEGKYARTHPLWLKDGHISPSSITRTQDGKLLIASSQSERRGITGIIDYRAIDIPAYAGYGYRHANRDETSIETRNNGFLKAWYDAHEFFSVPILDLIPAAFLHTFREIPLQLSKGVHFCDVGLSSKFLLTNAYPRSGQVDSALRLPKHFENNNWIPFHKGFSGIQQGLGVKSLDHIPDSNVYVAATAGPLVQDATKWAIKGHVPPVRVVTFTTERLYSGDELMHGQFSDSNELPARGVVSTLSEKLYNFSLLVVTPTVRKQLKSDPVRTVSDIAVLNDKQALFLEKTELPYQGAQPSFITRVYLVDLNSGKNFKGNETFVDEELNKVFMKTPADFMSKTLLFASDHPDSLRQMPDKPDFDIHEANFEAIALGPDTAQGDKTFMLVSYNNGEVKTQTRLLHFTLPVIE